MQDSKYVRIKVSSSTKSIRYTYKGTSLDFIFTLPLILFFTPIFVVNSLYALCLRRPIFIKSRELDALGRTIVRRKFSSGICKFGACFLDVFAGQYAFCGVTCCHRLNKFEQDRFSQIYDMPSGLFSLVSVNQLIGLNDISAYRLLIKQAQSGYMDYIFLLLKGFLSKIFECNHQHLDADKVRVFGIDIDNVKMHSAVDMVLNSPKCTTHPQIGFFINAHSLNLSRRDNEFADDLNKSTWSFADGSGIRLASLRKGQKIKENVNGTDMLPLLCDEAQKQGKTLYLLGAKEGIAELAARTLKQRFPRLKIVGTEHGYHKNYDDIIDRINAVKPDVLLVGMGSPYQERWILRHQARLHCNTVLAVGGLFDFFSNRIPRAPRWMRETGLEWLFRLYKEPLAKFSRYVIGTPEFLIRIFLLKQA